ncbi:MAG: efflux RND transporter permease subunit [Bacteroidales bacterium]|nr:efflux RND transporter permease subunit [Bacteroidales bacterium]
MLDKIIRFSLNNKYVILLCFLLLVVFGLRSAFRMDVDVFPDLTAPTVVVMTDCHGMTSEEVERLVSYPIETAMNGATGVRRVRSTSSQGFSFVWVEFDWGSDVFRARQVVSEKLVTLEGQIPEEVGPPQLAPQSSVMGEILFVSLQSDSISLMDLRDMAEWQVQPLLMATNGVAQVTIIGGDYKQFQVLADPYKMQYYHVTMEELKEACATLSDNSSGGVIREYGNEFAVRGIARTVDPKEMEKSWVKSCNGQPVCVGDVARVAVAPAQKFGYGSVNAHPAIVMSVSKQPGANTLEVTAEIERNLASLQKSLPANVRMNTRIFRQADFISTSVNNVERALWEGSVLVVLVLLLFLGNFRTTLISLLAIPLSLLATIIALKWLGMNINTMSLGGMAIAVGSLVDDAIIDVENVYKRLRQNRLKPDGERLSSFETVFRASSEIRASIMNATLIIMASFMPLFFLSGMEGRMLKPLGIAFLVSLFMSLVVAMTLTPLLSKMLLAHDKFLDRNLKDKWFTSFLHRHYERSLGWALSHKGWVLVPVFALFVAAVIFFFTLGRSFLPEFNEGSLTLSVVTQPGTSLDENEKIGNLVEQTLLSIPEVTSTCRRTGRGELDEHSQATHSAEIEVNFELSDRSKEAFVEEVREKLASIPGIASTVGQPLGHRIDHIISGTRANIAIKVFGNNLNDMYQVGNQIKSAISGVSGLVDVNVEQQIGVPELQIRARREMLARYGIPVSRFNDYVRCAIGGEKLCDIYDGPCQYDLILRLDSSYTQTIEGLKDALIDTDNGEKVPLGQVAEIVSSSVPSSISRENGQRKLVVSANVAGRDMRGAVEEIQQVVNEKVKLPEGCRISYGGQFESEAAASRMLLLTSLLALAVILMLLFREFRSFKWAAIILLNLPLALIGGVFAIKLTSNMLSIPAIIGFISLFGIATRNGLLLVSNYLKLGKQGLSVQETVMQGSGDRLNAILMTAITGALALIPMAVHGNLPGNEIQSPLAIVIIGGLLTSTLLNIYVIPIVYAMVHHENSKKTEKMASCH